MTEEDKAIFDQLPLEVKQRLYVFLYENFLHKYRKYFQLRNLNVFNENGKLRSAVYYNRFSTPFNIFMLEVL